MLENNLSFYQVLYTENWSKYYQDRV